MQRAAPPTPLGPTASGGCRSPENAGQEHWHAPVTPHRHSGNGNSPIQPLNSCVSDTDGPAAARCAAPPENLLGSPERRTMGDGLDGHACVMDGPGRMGRYYISAAICHGNGILGFWGSAAKRGACHQWRSICVCFCDAMRYGLWAAAGAGARIRNALAEL